MASDEHKETTGPRSDSPLLNAALNPDQMVNAFAHFYRAEMTRVISWRNRLDTTTNWAIAGATAILSVALSQPAHHQGLILFAMGTLYLVLVIEARRYRYFDVYRRRLRQFERGYYARLFAESSEPFNAEWLGAVAASLNWPVVTMTFQEALARRLRRNYWWLFLVLLAAWLLKVVGSLDPDRIFFNPADINVSARIGWTPGWVVLGLVLVFHGWLLFLMLYYGRAPEEAVYGEIQV